MEISLQLQSQISGGQNPFSQLSLHQVSISGLFLQTPVPEQLSPSIGFSGSSVVFDGFGVVLAEIEVEYVVEFGDSVVSVLLFEVILISEQALKFSWSPIPFPQSFVIGSHPQLFPVM